MTFQEKSLYHQIHPAKLLTDWSTGLIALYPFWHHNLTAALLIAFVPSIVASMVILRFADPETYKQSVFGMYVRQYMTCTVKAIPFVGYGIMAVGARWVMRGR
jgi:uncharacterized membrane protein